MAMDLVDYEIKGSEMQFVKIELDPGEAAVGKIKTALFGGEGLFFAKLSGPGTVWLQSLPFSRLASRVFAAAPQRGGSREEGSVLGGLAGGTLLGGMLGGDDD